MVVCLRTWRECPRADVLVLMMPLSATIVTAGTMIPLEIAGCCRDQWVPEHLLVGSEGKLYRGDRVMPTRRLAGQPAAARLPGTGAGACLHRCQVRSGTPTTAQNLMVARARFEGITWRFSNGPTGAARTSSTAAWPDVILRSPSGCLDHGEITA